MRISRFFIDTPLSANQTINLPPVLVNYIVNVLRLKSGNEIILFNGQGGEFSASLNEVKKRSAAVSVNHFIDKDIESPLKIHLLQGISRSERMDFSIQKAVELGVHQITPVFTQRSNARLSNAKHLAKKLRHWQGVALSACEQSGRTSLVMLNNPIQVEKIADYSADLQLILAPDADSGLFELSHLKPAAVNVFIGPEGGLSAAEIQLAVENNYQKISLGPRILRTETAGLSTLSVLQYLWGDLT